MPAFHVLMVEDDPADVTLTREALKESKLALNLHVVEDGEAALRFLRHQPPYAQAPRPDLVILDLQLPKIDGHEVLRRVKADPMLRAIPVCVVTASDKAEDVERAYKAGANCYVTKPVDLPQFARVVQAIESFWLMIVRRPG